MIILILALVRKKTKLFRKKRKLIKKYKKYYKKTKKVESKVHKKQQKHKKTHGEITKYNLGIVKLQKLKRQLEIIDKTRKENETKRVGEQLDRDIKVLRDKRDKKRV
jgi:hypothetical protein